MNYQLCERRALLRKTDFLHLISKTRLTRSANRKLRSLDCEPTIGQTRRQLKATRKSSGWRRELRTSGIISTRRPGRDSICINKRTPACNTRGLRFLFISGVSSRYHLRRGPNLRFDVPLTSSQSRIVTCMLPGTSVLIRIDGRGR